MAFLKIITVSGVKVKYVCMDLPIRHEGVIPDDFPLRKGDMWNISVDADTGEIKGFPTDIEEDIYLKVVDSGQYWLENEAGNQVGNRVSDYVPSGLPNEWGDYVDFQIKDGKITNWPKDIDLDEFANALPEEE